MDFATRRGEDQPRLLRMQSPVLNDGTQPHYAEPVHPALTTAAAARRWQLDPRRPEPYECNQNPNIEFKQEA